MGKNNSLFRFKQFAVSHSLSSMKVGVDGVLVALWASRAGCADRDANSPNLTALDVGTGCGVIALILAQRNPLCHVTAIDIHQPSVAEAAANFLASPWPSRLQAAEASFNDILLSGQRYDLIVSNPPFFDSGVEDFDSPRTVARHSGELSPSVLVSRGGRVLAPGGRLAMILPAEHYNRILTLANDSGLTLTRATFVRNHPGAPIKRVLMEFAASGSFPSIPASQPTPTPTELVMFGPDGSPTPEYRELGKDFYLKF